MDSYDPLQAPAPQAWFALEEDERIELIASYHEEAGIELPAAKLHTMLHSVIENQAAEGPEVPTAQVLERLQSEGLDRHDAIHACCGVLVEHMQGLMDVPDSGDPNAPYFRSLKKLKAQAWLDSFRD